jgi:hypothetical protein
LSAVVAPDVRIVAKAIVNGRMYPPMNAIVT